MTKKSLKILIYMCVVYICIFIPFSQMSISPASGATFKSLLENFPVVDDFELSGSTFSNKTGSWGISVSGNNGKDMHQTVTINADGGLGLLNDKYGNARSTGIEAVNTLKAIRQINGIYTELELNPYEYLEYEEHTEFSSRKIDNLDTSFYNLKTNPLGFDEKGNKLNFNHNGDYLGFQILVDTNNSNFTGIFPEEYSGATEVRHAGKSIVTPEPVRVEARDVSDGQLLLPIYYEIGDTGYVNGFWNINNPFVNEKILMENDYRLEEVTLDGVPTNENVNGIIDEQQHTIVFWYDKNTTSSSSLSNDETSNSKETSNSQESKDFESTTTDESTYDTKKIENEETVVPFEINPIKDRTNTKQQITSPSTNDNSDTQQQRYETKITKKINGVDKAVYDDFEKEINWEITVSFGNDMIEWEKANIVDEIPSILEIQNIEITNKENQDISGIGRLEIRNNQVRFEIYRVEDSFKHLSNKTVIMNIRTKIRLGVNEQKIERYMNN